MWISLPVAMLVVHAVGSNPRDGSPFEGKSAANCKDVFDCLRYLVTAVDQQTVITPADAAVDCKNVKNNRDNQVGPAEEEEGRNRANVKNGHEDGGDPDQA